MVKKYIIWLTIIIISACFTTALLYFPVAIPTLLALLLVCSAVIVIREVK